MSEAPTGDGTAPEGTEGAPSRLAICVGATKAGTSWFYRTLKGNPACSLRAVKEVHYWDTFDPAERSLQIAHLAREREGLTRQRDEAAAQSLGWKVRNMNRRIRDSLDLEAMLAAPREGDRAYLHWLTEGAAGRLVADVTPVYATLDDDLLARAVALSPDTRVVYLLRDPVARLWSHVRMQAARNLPQGRELGEKANNILWRVLYRGEEQHLMARGDYPATVARLRRVVPAERLHIDYCERLFRPEGQADMARFLGLDSLGGDAATREHEGPKVEMRDDLRPVIIEAMRDHYAWAAREVGPLPAEWQARLTGEAA